MGDKDTDFMGWLKDHDIVVHAHKPKWTAIIERLRLAGDPNTSHLFAHAGNYLGTWQRIDIPNLIESEYILYLDADTVVTKAFTMGDFGLDITAHIAFSIEQEKGRISQNAGVTLMNVPKLRETKSDFLKFIAGGETKPFKNGPSDQGAYIDFYHPDFLDRRFNIKPYFNDMEGRKVMHFHGPKPYEIYKFMIGMEIPRQMTRVIKKADSNKPLCTAMMAFAKSASVEPGIISEYCTGAFADEPMLSKTCTEFLEILHTLDSSSGCDNMAIYRFKSLQNLEEPSPGFIKVIDQKNSTIDYSIPKEQSPGFIKVIDQKNSTIDYSIPKEQSPGMNVIGQNDSTIYYSFLILNRFALVILIAAIILFAKSSKRTKNAGKIFMNTNIQTNKDR
jgi:hypothetical protein